MPFVRRHSLLRHRGFALMLMLLLIGAGVGAGMFSFFSPNTLTLESDQKTSDALATAKAALIAYAVTRGGVAGADRPGEFPCPDTRSSTDIFYGTENITCGGAAVALGRVPWRALGIPEPKDAAGETLWYAVANPFRRNPPNALPINSDTRGNLTVFGADGVTPLTTEAVAVIFAPGPALGGQTRGGANQNIAANYLETSNGINNADAVPPTGPFIAGRLRAPNNPNYNDRLLYITTGEFIPAVEMRVATEVQDWLDAYRANSDCECYPWADTFAGANGTSDDGVNRGRFPLTARPENWGTNLKAGWPAIPIPSLWFGANNWHNVIYYALAKQNAQNQGLLPPLCTTCIGTALSVDGKAVISAIFFMPGTPRGALPRPSNTLANYLEDAVNNDNANDTYITPTATTVDRDRIYTSISAPATVQASQQCEAMGKALRKLASCGKPPKLNPKCARLAGTDLNGVLKVPPEALQLCPACALASFVLVNPPCQSNLKATVCKNAYDTLKNC